MNFVLFEFLFIGTAIASMSTSSFVLQLNLKKNILQATHITLPDSYAYHNNTHKISFYHSRGIKLAQPTDEELIGAASVDVNIAHSFDLCLRWRLE
jgi:hypothetical protein